MVYTYKTLLAAILLCFITSLNTSVVAQEFNTSSIDLNMQIGVSANYTDGIIGIPPLSVSVDYGLPIEASPGILSAGVFLATSTSRFDYIGYNIKHSHYLFAARSCYHYKLSDALDTYAGLLLGARVIKVETGGTIPAAGISTSYTKAMLAIFAGAKYYFYSNMAIMAELGYGYTWLNAGVCIRMK